jgi:hypothetical protein
MDVATINVIASQLEGGECVWAGGCNYYYHLLPMLP